MTSEGDTERVAVRTYVPAYQRETWREEADRMDMSQSEFVRTMVQAGRRGFDLDSTGDEGDEPASNPRGNALKDRVVDLLREEGPCSWDDLLAGVTDDVEARLEDALAELQQTNRVQYSGRDGGYTLTDEQ